MKRKDIEKFISEKYRTFTEIFGEFCNQIPPEVATRFYSERIKENIRMNPKSKEESHRVFMGRKFRIKRWIEGLLRDNRIRIIEEGETIWENKYQHNSLRVIDKKISEIAEDIFLCKNRSGYVVLKEVDDDVLYWHVASRIWYRRKKSYSTPEEAQQDIIL